MLILLDLLAEREGFEPPIALRLCLISSQVESRKRSISIRVLFCAKFRCYLAGRFANPLQTNRVCRAILNDALIVSDNEHAVRWVQRSHGPLHYRRNFIEEGAYVAS